MPLCDLSSLRRDTKQWRKFAYMSANFQHILGLFDLSQQLNLFFNYQAYARQRSKAPLLESITGCEAERHNLSLMRAQRRMWVSYHLGIYQSIPIRLMMSGISLCVIVARDVLKDYRAFYTSVIRKIHLEGKMCFQDAEDPHLFFRLRKHVEAGYDVFVFADGAFGSAQPSQQKLHKITLLDGAINVRTGFMRIAQLLGLTVTKIVERSSDCPSYRLLEVDELGCHKQGWVDSPTNRCVQNLYQAFERDLSSYPHMWETWRYLHQHYHPTSELATWDSIHRIIPIKEERGYRLLDKFTYRIHEIDRRQYESLSKLIF